MNPYELGNRVSTFNFFKNYNSLVATSGTETVLPEQYMSKLQFTLPHHHQSCLLHSSAYLAEEKALKACISTPLFRPMVRNVFTSDAVKLKLLDVFGGNFSEANHSNKRQRSEKKRIPEEQKDEKYFERRKRNNQAAKKSRDARKLREDQVALRAAVLEHENAILKTQVLTLQEETASLRHLLYQKKAFDLHGGEIRS